jgi:phenylpropionate dioxygenase-like ring-hydroxylating dioxygenase large terminal subunit
MVNNPNLFLRDIWYYALPSDRLKSGKMVAKTLLNEPILFGRTSDGNAFALRDICPHRAIPLSNGRFDGREIECCYHGWRFDRTGRCTAIPALNPNQKLDEMGKIRVQHYPVREVQGNIWIYMQAKTKANIDLPELDAPLVPDFEDCCYQILEIMRFPCFIDHAIVGLMDPAHVPFVHRAWWWRSDVVLSDEIKTFVPSPYGFTMKRHRLERQTFFYSLIGKDLEIEISFQLPGVRIERLTTKKHTVCNLTTITPISETETEVTTSFYTTLPWFTPLKPLLLPFMRTFLNQDREMVVKQQVGLQYNPPLMLIEDADTQANWYYQLKTEFARAVAQNRSFINPVKERVLHWRS